MSHPHFPQLAQPPKPEFQYLTDAIGERFRVHHIEGDSHRYAFFVRELADGGPLAPETDAVDRAFEDLRVDLKKYSYVPTLQRVGEQGILTVVRIPDPEFRSSRVNWFMFVATLATVQWAGAYLWASYLQAPSAEGFGETIDIASAEAMTGGFLYFTLPLLSILGLHEMGHFIVARHYRVRASLPFFIPSVPPLGTFGAFISMRDPLPSRRAIFDIGISGPLVGFVAACVVTVVGVFLTQATPQLVRPEDGGGAYFGSPLVFDFLNSLFVVPDSYLHPTSFAGWAGFLVTAFNLIPAAQLDGGHVFYSMIPNRPRRETVGVAVSFLAVVAIAGWGVIEGYVGWLLLLIIVLATIRHPPALNQISKLGWARVAAGGVAILVFTISFVPAPVHFVEPDYTFEVAGSPLSVDVPAGGVANASVRLANLGNTFNLVEVTVGGTLGNFTALFNGSLNSTQVILNRLEYLNRTVNFTLTSGEPTVGAVGAVQIVFKSVRQPSQVYTVVVPVRTVAPHPGLEVSGTAGPFGGQRQVAVTIPITLTNTGDTLLSPRITATALNNTSWSNWGFVSGGNITKSTNASVQPWSSLNVTFVVTVPDSVPTDPGQANSSAVFRFDLSEAHFPALDRTFTVRVAALP